MHLGVSVPECLSVCEFTSVAIAFAALLRCAHA